jgi:SAM-dependent methyltransferase
MTTPLQAGDRHYRAYVGPPERYDLMGLSQMGLLFALGIRESSRILDIGCGSLRVGRLLIPFLQAGHYCAIEPNRWLVQKGILHNLGFEMYLRKRPRFSHSADFRYDGFGGRFDFIVAQSILSHTEAGLARRCLSGLRDALTDQGLFLGTFLLPNRAESCRVDPEGEAWCYPDCVSFSEPRVDALFQASGLAYWKLAWFHPRQTWYAASRGSGALNAAEAALMNGYARGFCPRP